MGGSLCTGKNGFPVENNSSPRKQYNNARNLAQQHSSPALKGRQGSQKDHRPRKPDGDSRTPSTRVELKVNGDVRTPSKREGSKRTQAEGSGWAEGNRSTARKSLSRALTSQQQRGGSELRPPRGPSNLHVEVSRPDPASPLPLPTPSATTPSEDDKFEDPSAFNSHAFTGRSGDNNLQVMIDNVGPPLEQATPIRWAKGSLLGSGGYGRVYMGMNLDSGELLAVKQVLIATQSTTREKAQEHVKALEAEVAVLRNLSHPNIVRYLGTERADEYLNIFLEFVPGGSIASLLSKFGAFEEKVIRRYTKQLLQGLEYLHRHKIMHRDIKGANILVHNQGVIKLADFGASKKLQDLATASEAKSMRGTAWWMAPEVIKQIGHGRQADIWSVGCTVLEMATGKPPWSQYSSEVSAMFYIASSKGPPPMPETISPECKDFLFKCLQRSPKDRPTAEELLRHPFVIDAPLQSINGPIVQPMPTRTPPAPILESMKQSFSQGWSKRSLTASIESDCTPRGFETMDVTLQEATATSLRRMLAEEASPSRDEESPEERPIHTRQEVSSPGSYRGANGLSNGGHKEVETRRDVERLPGRYEMNSVRSDVNPLEEPSYTDNVSDIVIWDTNVSEDEADSAATKGDDLNGINLSQKFAAVSNRNSTEQEEKYPSMSPSPPQTPSPLADSGERGMSFLERGIDDEDSQGEAPVSPVNEDVDEVVTETKIMSFLQEQAAHFQEQLRPLMEQRGALDSDSFTPLSSPPLSLTFPPSSPPLHQPLGNPRVDNLGTPRLGLNGTPRGPLEGGPYSRSSSGAGPSGGDDVSPSLARKEKSRNNMSNTGGPSNSHSTLRSSRENSEGSTGFLRGNRPPVDSPWGAEQAGPGPGSKLGLEGEQADKRRRWEEDLLRDLAYVRERQSLARQSREEPGGPFVPTGSPYPGRDLKFARLASAPHGQGLGTPR